MTEGLKWTVNQVPKSDDRFLDLMSEENVAKANEFHKSFPQYTVTPLQKLSALASYLGVKNHVQQYVAQLLANVSLVIFNQGITKFVNLFYRIRTQTFVGLFTIPRTFYPQFIKHIEQSPERFHLFFSGMHKINIF